MKIDSLLSLLSAAKARYTMLDDDDGVTFLVSVPFEKWEIELRSGRVVRVERFISTRDRLAPSDLSQMIRKIGMFP